MTNPIPAVAAYDPYLARAIDGIRAALADGHPVMVRLHPAGMFSDADDPVGDMLDREGHAVLLTGYDDALHAFRYLDPVSATESLLGFDEFGHSVVDSTFDFALVISDLVVVAQADAEHVEVSVSLYQPRMPVIDDQLTRISDVAVHLSDGRTIVASPVGEGSHVAVLAHEEMTMASTVTAVLSGVRPLPYRRVVSQPIQVPVATA